MPHPLLGLATTLADAECGAVILRPAGAETTMLFQREGDDAWVSDALDSDPLHTEELIAKLHDGFGREFDRVECLLPREKVVYALEAGSVRIRRETRGEEAAGAAAPPGLVAVTDALGIPKSKRKPKLTQAVQFARIVERAVAPMRLSTVRLLDLACGRSYLGLVLVEELAARGRTVQLHGVDSNPTLTAKCGEMARALKWPNCTFERADLAAFSVPAGAYDVVVSLHACDTLTDEAIRIAWEARSPLLFLAPCCQHELRHMWRAHPLDWVARYGLLEQRLADVLTDGFRCLVLEALGYRVKVLRFAAPDVTPKNLLIQAELVSGTRRERADAAWGFARQFGVRPKLAAVLEAAMLGG